MGKIPGRRVSTRVKERKCSGCSWVYPATYGGSWCKFCKAPVYAVYQKVPGNCPNCGAYIEDIYHFPGKLCSKCYSKKNYQQKMQIPGYKEKILMYNNEHWHRVNDRAAQSYKDWLEQLKSVSTHSLTEDEWLEACQHFKGCAFCSSDSIDARQYFIPFKDGGNYTACNVVPACEQCATALKGNPNPFVHMNKLLTRNKAMERGQSVHTLKGITDYLQSKIEEAKNESAGKNGSL